MKDMSKKALRRGHNEGNIRQRTDGRWEVRLSAGIDYKTGKPDPDSLQLQIYALLAGLPDAQLLFLPLAAADHSDATLQPVAPSLPLPDARDQAAQLLQSIRAHRWWPPKGKYLEQTFPGLFLGGDPQKSFDPDWIAAHQAR